MGLLAANNEPRHLAGVSPAVTSNRGGVRSELARVDGSTRQGHQRIARARAHLGGPTGGAGVAGNDDGVEPDGGRSSGVRGTGAAVCKRDGCRASFTLRDVVSATDAGVGPKGHRGFAGDEPVRRSVSAPVEGAARARNQTWG